MTNTAARTPQQDRSRATRQKLLEAAIECLAEVGWTGSTVTVVAERAGVSRGAAQHHFPTRDALFTGAIAHVAAVRAAELRTSFAGRPVGSLTTLEVVDKIVEIYTGPLFRAALVLWVASSSEPTLREQVVPLERSIGRDVHQGVVTLLGVDESQPGVRESIQATLELARGLGLANLLTDDSRRRRGIVVQWARMLEAALAPAAG